MHDRLLPAIALFVTACLIAGCREDPGPANAAKCRKQLQSLQQLVELYRADHAGVFPPGFDALASTYGGPLQEVLTCPASTKRGSPNSGVDYVLVDYSKSGVPANLAPGGAPLIFDGSIHNHAGSGVNIVMVDGSLRWDQGAAWLKAFAREHPGVVILLPQP